MVVDVFKPGVSVNIIDVARLETYLEMGQGTFTGLATLAAEELDLSIEKIQVMGSPADVARYANPAFAKRGLKSQGTGGVLRWQEPGSR